MKLAVQVSGIQTLKRALKKGTPKFNPDILRKPMREWAIDTVSIAKTEYLNGPRPQRLGRVTGRLSRSVMPDMRSAPLWAEVGTNVEYAPTHELGLNKRKRRPFIKPAAEKAFRRFEQDLLIAWAGAMK